jgi:hypothetical protein
MSIEYQTAIVAVNDQSAGQDRFKLYCRGIQVFPDCCPNHPSEDVAIFLRLAKAVRGIFFPPYGFLELDCEAVWAAARFTLTLLTRPSF